MLSPSPKSVRVLYCVCLLSAGLSLFKGLHSLALLLGSPGALGVMNIMVAVVPNAATAALFILVAARFVGVAAGRFKLNTVATSGPIRVLRVIAICLMTISVLPWLFSLAGVLMHRGAESVGFILLFASLGGGSSVGILLFEATRLLEREVLLEAKLRT